MRIVRLYTEAGGYRIDFKFPDDARIIYTVDGRPLYISYDPNDTEPFKPDRKVYLGHYIAMEVLDLPGGDGSTV